MTSCQTRRNKEEIGKNFPLIHCIVCLVHFLTKLLPKRSLRRAKNGAVEKGFAVSLQREKYQLKEV